MTPHWNPHEPTIDTGTKVFVKLGSRHSWKQAFWTGFMRFHESGKLCCSELNGRRTDLEWEQSRRRPGFSPGRESCKSI